jgi:hypothetical protein
MRARWVPHKCRRLLCFLFLFSRYNSSILLSTQQLVHSLVNAIICRFFPPSNNGAVLVAKWTISRIQTLGRPLGRQRFLRRRLIDGRLQHPGCLTISHRYRPCRPIPPMKTNTTPPATPRQSRLSTPTVPVAIADGFYFVSFGRRAFLLQLSLLPSDYEVTMLALALPSFAD